MKYSYAQEIYSSIFWLHSHFFYDVMISIKSILFSIFKPVIIFYTYVKFYTYTYWAQQFSPTWQC